MTLRVLSVASEAFPLIKTGGLADVVGALPAALAPHDVQLTTLIPGYPAVMKALDSGEILHRYTDLLGVEARLVGGNAGGLDVIVLDAPSLFARGGGLYADEDGKAWKDNWQRFAALGRAGADIARGEATGLRPDLLHAHDWQAAMAAAYLRYDGGGVPSIVTIHNMAFQGWFPAEVFASLGLPPEAYGIDGVEYFGGVGFLKAGLQAAGAITTVSPTYAEQIREPEFAAGLEGLIAARHGRVFGIVNGIDTDVWNPGSDPDLAAPYDGEALQKRIHNRRAVQQKFGLIPGNGPLFCVVSRLTVQKGMDVLADCAGALVGLGARLAVLGNGDAELEAAFTAAAARYPGRIAVHIGYDEALSHLLQGGADAILIPSRFEPCGLTQLYAMRYGSVPIAARTGGLADTIVDTTEETIADGTATGFLFDDVSEEGLTAVLARATQVFARRAAWQGLQRRGMETDVSWHQSGARYAELYKRLADGAA